MTSIEIRQIIIEELLEGSINNNHGISLSNLSHHLVEPALTEYINASDGAIEKYWLVLDEQPGEKEQGYQIIFDPREQEFGLATKGSIQSKDFGSMIGLYGSFIDALKSM